MLPRVMPSRYHDRVTDEEQSKLLAAWSTLDDGLDAEFAALLPQWDAADVHRKLLQQLSLRGLLREGGLRYQKAKLIRPNDGAIAAAQDTLLKLAMASMQRVPIAEKAAAAGPGRYIVGFLLFALVALAVGRLGCQALPKPTTTASSDG
jgi:hypothetical protein